MGRSGWIQRARSDRKNEHSDEIDLVRRFPWLTAFDEIDLEPLQLVRASNKGKRESTRPTCRRSSVSAEQHSTPPVKQGRIAVSVAC